MNLDNIRRMAGEIYDGELADELLALAIRHAQKLCEGTKISEDFREDEYIAALIAVRQAVILDSAVSAGGVKAGEITLNKRDSVFIGMLSSLIREELAYIGGEDPDFVFDAVGGDNE